MTKNLKVFTTIALITFICYGILLAIGSQKGFPKERYGNGFFHYLSERPFSEDGFYSLSVSWNIASGKGITYNGKIPTTGFQPLSVFIESVLAYAVVIFGGDKYLFLRIVLIFSVLLQTLFAYFIYLIANALTLINNKKISLFVSMLCVLFNFKLFIIFTNGLESGLYLAGLAYFFYYLLTKFENKNSLSSTFIFGLLSGLLLLTRSDFILILLPLLSIMIFRKEISLRKAFIVCIYTLIVFSPWLIYTYSVTGSFLSSSVQIQTGIIGSYELDLRIDHFLTSVIHYLTPFLYTGIKIKAAFYLIGVVYIGVLVFLLISFYKEIFITEKLKKTLWYTSPIVLLSTIYLLYSSAPYFYIRYLSPISIIALPVFVIIASKVISGMKEIIAGSFYVFVIIIFFIHAALFFHTGKSSMSYSYRPGYIQKNFKEGIKIAAFQSGTLEYFLPNIYNLDGKVDYNAIRYSRSGNLDRYIDSLNIDVMLAWEQYMPNFRSKYISENWDVYSLDIGDSQSMCFIRKKQK